MLSMIYSLLFCAMLTFLLELPITCIFFSIKNYKNVIVNCLRINFATNLSINLILCFYRTDLLIYILEVLVVITEYYLWTRCYGNHKIRILVMCICANAFSYVMGRILL